MSRLAQRVGERSATRGLRLHHAIADWAVGLLHLGLGRWDAAAARLQWVVSGPSEHPVVARRATPDLVEAAVQSNQHDLARAAAALITTRTSGPPWSRSLAARCRALIAEIPPSGSSSCAPPSRSSIGSTATEPGAVELLLGEHLRRARRRGDTREPLHAALDTFERLGAAPWAQRAERELRATGQTARRRVGPALSELTPQEQHIAALVADGATNREVAAELFLSGAPSTTTCATCSPSSASRRAPNWRASSSTRRGRHPADHAEPAISPMSGIGRGATVPA